jgi:hypothetical protein
MSTVGVVAGAEGDRLRGIAQYTMPLTFGACSEE